MSASSYHDYSSLNKVNILVEACWHVLSVVGSYGNLLCWPKNTKKNDVSALPAVSYEKIDLSINF